MKQQTNTAIRLPRAESRGCIQRAFTLTEMLIVVAILGIFAAIILPEFQSRSEQAKEAAAKDTLRVVRNSIELYAARNNGVPPGYIRNDPQTEPAGGNFIMQMRGSGKYLPIIPINPFNDLQTMLIIKNAEDMPAAATGQYGWIYKASTKTFKIDWPGTDENGLRYYDY